MKSRRIALRAMMCALQLLLANSAESRQFADTLFVSKSGSDAFNGQTRSQALATIGMSFKWAALVNGQTLILVDDGVYDSEIFPLQAPDKITLRGENGAENVVIDGGGKRLMELVAVENVDLENFTLRNGSADGASGEAANGGGLYLASVTNCRLTNLKIHDNFAAENGGGVYIENDAATIFENCEIFENESRLGAGLYFSENSAAEMTECHIHHNSAGYSGGGVYVASGAPRFFRNRISFNRRTAGTQKGAGGVTVENGDPLIGGSDGEGNDIYGNVGGEKGTQLYVEGDSIVNARFNYWGVKPSSRTISKIEKADYNNFRNIAVNIPFGTHHFYVSPNGDNANDGASRPRAWRTISYAVTQFYSSELDTNTIHLLPGIYAPSPEGETFPIQLKRNLSVVGDSAGVIFDGLDAGDASIFSGFEIDRTALKNITFQNMRGTKFGVIFMEGSHNFVAANCLFKNNFAPTGGCIVLVETKDSEIHDNIFENNWADKGGVIYASGDKADVYRNIFRNNFAKRGGAVALGNGSKSFFYENEFHENKADSGGVFYLIDAFPELENNRLTENAAFDIGGAIAMNSASLPEIGGRSSKSNDIYDNTAGIRGSRIARFGTGLTVEARHNFWSDVPDSSMLSPFEQFAVSPFRTISSFTDQKERKFYVSPFGDNSGDGLTPENAWRSISYAVKQFFVIDSEKITLSLAPGVYSLSSAGEAFPLRLRNHTVIEGAAGGETILDAEKLSRVLILEGGRQIELRHLIFENGAAASENGGGALLRNASNLLIEDCIFRGNSSAFGGGLALENAFSTVIQNNTFFENVAENSGGGAWLNGDSLIFSGNILYANRADSAMGGGVVVDFAKDFFAAENEIYENQASKGGGAAFFSSDGEVFQNRIVRNHAGTGGGILLESSPKIVVGGANETGNDIYGNTAAGDGSQLFTLNSGRVDANGNFWAQIPTSALVSGTLPVDFSSYRSVTSRVPHETREFFFSPEGDDLNSGFGVSSPWKSLHAGFERVFAAPGDSMFFILTPGVYSASTGQQLPIQIEDGVHLFGQTTVEDTVIFDGENQSRVFEARGLENISLKNLLIRNGFHKAEALDSADFPGGAGLLARGVKTLTLKNVVFFGNDAPEGFGGALALVDSSENVVMDSLFFQNNAAAFGGGFYAENAEKIAIANSRFWSNSGTGGGFFLRESEARVVHSNFVRNSSPRPGSAMFFAGASTGKILKNLIIENTVTASDTSAAIAIERASLPVIGGAPGDGNDIYNNKGGKLAHALTRIRSLTPSAGRINAQFNYFAAETIDDALATPLSEFDLTNMRTLPISLNHKPIVSTVTPEPGEVKLDAPQTVTFSVEAIDFDNDPLLYVWAVNGGGVGTKTSYTLPERKLGARDHIKLRLSDGKFDIFLEWFVNTGVVTSVDETEDGIPTAFALSQNYPNPFNPATAISFALPKKSSVRIAIFSATGALVKTLVHDEMPAGFHQIKWRGADETGAPSASGVYFIHMQADDFEARRKMILLR